MNRKDLVLAAGFVILILLDLLILSYIQSDSDRLTSAAVLESRPEPTRAVLIMNGNIDDDSDLVKCCEVQDSEGKSCYSLKSSGCIACDKACR